MMAPLDSDLYARTTHDPWQAMAAVYQEEARKRRRDAIRYVNWRRNLHWWERILALDKLRPKNFDEGREWAKYKNSDNNWVAYYGME